MLNILCIIIINFKGCLHMFFIVRNHIIKTNGDFNYEKERFIF